MREIKFRAWTNNLNKMIHNVSTGVIDIFDEFTDGAIPSKDCEFMQYTGIKDKNGKEIYEGDIATQHKLRAEHLGEKNFEIIYYQDECGFEIATLSEDRKERYLTPLHKTIEIEVIGNIYENANLLK